MKAIAIIGTVGVPGKYGGFETLVENLLRNKYSNDIKYTVVCSSKSYDVKQDSYMGADLKYVNFKANGLQSVIYDIISFFLVCRTSDVILVLGVSGCCILPIFRFFYKKKLIINIDGLEHKRDKWGKFARKFLKFSEKMAVKYADTIISDNKAIQEYVIKEYGKNSEMIAYGGNHVFGINNEINEDKILQELGLKEGEYYFSVCRIEPENNLHIILEAFAQCGKKYVVVGNWYNSPYGQNLLDKYNKYPNIKMLSPIYDVGILYALRSSCKAYIHGHSAGGTNPSLVEAMHFGIPIFTYDVIYNRETTENDALYFKDSRELIEILDIPAEKLSSISNRMKDIANNRYKWETISKEYEALFVK